jgi:hypothetical protein
MSPDEHRDLGPPGPEDGEGGTTPDPADVEEVASTTTDTNIVSDPVCRCAVDEPCVCHYYENWTCDWDSPQDTPSQLRRRREAALRVRPLEHSGRRDPISPRLGRWAA